MASVPTTITQFLSIAVPVIINVCLFAILAGCFVFTGGKWGFISAPLCPDSRVGKAKGLIGWLRAVGSLKDEDVLKMGGLDAYLALQRSKMRAEIAYKWCLIAIPVAVIYALNVTGGNTEGGFSRITFENANVVKLNESGRTGSSGWRVWITVVAMYLMPILAVPIIERYDEEAVEMMLEESKKAPMNHYAVVLTGVDEASRNEATLRSFFDAALGEGSVRKIYLVTNESAIPEGVVDEEPTEDDDKKGSSLKNVTKFAGSLLTSLGGTRQRFDAFKAAMKAAKRADLAFENAKTKNQEPKEGEEKASHMDSFKKMAGASKSPAELRKDARVKLEEKRQALVRAADVPGKSTAAAVVVFDSVAKATSAATAPLGIANAWRVAPAPEPRDVLWTALETADSDQEIIDQKAATGERIKFLIAASWGIILVAINWAAQFILTIAQKQLSGGLKTIIILISGFVPGLIAPIMMSLMVTILNNLNVAFRSGIECWSFSAVQNRTTTDFVFFLIVVGFFVPLLGSALIVSILDGGAEPIPLFKGMAINVPLQGYYFSMIMIVKMAVFLNGATRFVPWIVYRLLSAILCKTDFEKSLLQKPQPIVFAAASGWETFAFLLCCVYTQLSPYVPAMMAIYLGLQVPCVRLDLACISKTPFATNGLLWRQAVVHTYDCMFAGACLTLLVLLFANWPIHFACSLPLIVIHGIIRGRARHRYELRSVHGAARGRLPLLEAAQVDQSRPSSVIDTEILPTMDHDRLFAPRHALPLSTADRRSFLPGGPVADDDDDDLEVSQRLIDAWEDRYNTANAVALPSEKTTQVEALPVKGTTV